MKLFSLILVNFVIISTALAHDYTPFGSVSVTPNTVAIVMRDLPPCTLQDGSGASDFPAYMPAADVAGVTIQNDTDHPLELEYMTLETDQDVLEISTDKDIRAMFPTGLVPAHSSVTSMCGLHVGNINLGREDGPTSIQARLDVLAQGRDSHDIVTQYENKANLTLHWDGKY